jgi:hypothetical protein
MSFRGERLARGDPQMPKKGAVSPCRSGLDLVVGDEGFEPPTPSV